MSDAGRYTREQLEAEARSHLAYWQPALLLLEWDIRLEVVDKPAEESKFAAASTQPDRELRLAVIRFWLDFWSGQRESTSDWGGPRYQSVEATLVHELLHVRLAEEDAYMEWARKRVFGTVQGDEWEEARETAINLLARSLVALRKRA